ncbi:ABC transporter substrate-binding protein [Cohnella lupini]|uniref:MarR-like DNA-binding transcriptional regulator SgrR of sgrS sRNA n=1 Tax=Cohnella lupini TaxID=1294267 RepID=A0A3D9HYP2_9BACL|nr:ABC transporter substrate-binding protein [Cohnella lupini]RED54519.1 MarR-like DNA-binding transcriptional regulator SgrR of sgrS sRNA [Cohnella lupini]
MRDFSYYEMRAFLYEREVENMVEFKLLELESIWFCDRKNVKRKLKKYEQEGRFRYDPGIGRGNLSRLTFARTFQDEVEQAVLACVNNDQLEDIIRFLQLPVPKSWIAEVSKEVQQLFGLHSPDHEKDILRTIVMNKVSTLDPLAASITLERYCIQQLGDTLVVYDPITEEVRPHLAYRWISENNHSSWTFYLRKGVRFHHHRTLTSEDVVYTFRRFQGEKAPMRWLVQDIQEMECLSPYVVRLRLNRPNLLFPRYLCACNLSILPKDEPFAEHKWIGTGPFRLKKRSDTLIVLEAFDQYFLERPFLDEVELYLASEEATEAMIYLNKDHAPHDPASLKEDVLNKFRYLAFNFRKSPVVRELKFREALYHLLDMDQMRVDLGRESLVAASSFVPWKSSLPIKSRDEAKRLLAQSGYEGERLTLYANNVPQEREEARWFAEMAAAEGISVDCVYFHMKDFYDRSMDHAADFIFMGESASADPYLSILDSFYNDSLIYRRFLSEEHIRTIDRMLEGFKIEPDKTERERWINRIESYVRNEHLILFRYHPVFNRAIPAIIQNIRSADHGYDDFRKSWIEHL